MKTRTAIMATLLASTGAIWTEDALAQCNQYYYTPKHLIDDREYQVRENVITEPLSELHDFTDEDGKMSRGRVMAYDPDKEVVTIAIENGKTLRADMGTFSKADQAYVREWHRIIEFFKEFHCRISTPKIQGRAGEEFLIWKPEKSIIYDITLRNRGYYNLNELTLDYLISYELYQEGNRGRVVKQGVKNGKLNIATLAHGVTVQVKTQPLDLPNGIPYEYYKDHKEPIGRVKGICIRIYLPLTTGRKVMREFCMPAKLRNHYEWLPKKVVPII